MEPKETINKFYTSFAEGNIQGMLECYHKDVVFEDAVFGKLEGERAFNMWRMLISQKQKDTIITFDNVIVDSETGRASWVAKYNYGPKKRPVVNRVHAEFIFKEGKIIEHIDTFDLYVWTKQAMGLTGYLLGWTSFIKNKIQKTVNDKLDSFINK